MSGLDDRVRVELTLDETLYYAGLGAQRSIHASWVRTHPPDGSLFVDRGGRLHRWDVEGLLAEAAVAKWLGVWFQPVIDRPDSAEGDVPPDIQVRHTNHPNGHLRVNRRDDPNHKYVLVIGAGGRYDVVGWMRGWQVQKDEFWGELGSPPVEAYWAPQRVLTAPMALLYDIVPA